MHGARRVGDHQARHGVDRVALMDVRRVWNGTTSTATSWLRITSALATTSAHVWQLSDENTATSHGADGSQKSARSSCAGSA